MSDVKTGLSRRGFLKAGAAGVAIKISLLSSATQAELIETPPRRGADWLAPGGKPKYRLDAIAKVTGGKTFTRDYRARDLEGWPKEQAHAFMLNATRVDRVFDGVDLGLLGDELKPDRLVLHKDLVADGVAMPAPWPGFYGDVFFVPKGQTARLLGQPVAMLIYHDFARYDAAKRKLRFNDKVVRYGAKGPSTTPGPYGAARYVRIDGGSPDAEDRYSALKDTTIRTGFKGNEPQWPTPGTVTRWRGAWRRPPRSSARSPMPATTCWCCGAPIRPSRPMPRRWRLTTAMSGTSAERESCMR